MSTPRPAPRRRPHAHALAALAALTLAATAHAQTFTREGRKDQQPAEKPEIAETGRILDVPEFTEQTLPIPSLGIALRLPVDSFFDLSDATRGRTQVHVNPRDPREQWAITIFSAATPNENASLASELDKIIDHHRQTYRAADAREIRDPKKDLADPSKLRYTLVREFDRVENLRIGPQQTKAVRTYLEVPEAPDQPVWGYTIVERGKGQFAVFKLDTTRDALTETRLLYEMLIAEATFRDPRELGRERGLPLLAGRQLLQSVTDDELDALTRRETERFFRVFSPGKPQQGLPEKEIAWQRISVRTGPLGELDPTRPASHWTRAEKEQGYIVQVDAHARDERTLRDPVTGQPRTLELTVQSVGLFWLSKDRQRERWSIRNEVTGQTIEQVTTLALIRDGRDMTIRSQPVGDQPTEVDYHLPSQGYISKVEQYLLPRIVARRGTPGQFAFYNYDPTLAKVTLRRETFRQSASDRWLQITRHSENSAPVQTALTPDGFIARQEKAGGAQIMEPATRQWLARTWTD